MDDFNSRKINYIDPNTLPQFDELMNDPNGVEKVKAVMHQARLSKNIMHISEFTKYIPLFQYSGKDTMSADEYEALSLEYANRICRFDPVRIVGDDNEILFELPPVFNRTNPINISGRRGEEFAQAFINVCMLPDEVSSEKRARYSEFYKQLFDIAQDNQAHVEKIKQAEEMSKTALDRIGNKDNESDKDSEISDIDSLDLKDNASSSSNTREVQPLGDDDDEIEYM